MTPTLNHTIVSCRDRRTSARYLADVLGLSEPTPWGPFVVVALGNGVSLDFRDHGDPEVEIVAQHYAFLVSDDEFDEIFGRIEATQPFWADPALTRPGQVNRRDGGRGVYFTDPDGHVLEILTRPYGSGG